MRFPAPYSLVLISRDVRRSVLVCSGSLNGILNSESVDAPPSVHRIDVRPNGAPVIITTTPAAYAYKSSNSTWTELTSVWWQNSPTSEIGRSNRSHGPSGPLGDIEAEVLSLSKASTFPGQNPEWWSEALELGHLETRIRAAELLESKDEYKFWILKYASALGREGFRERADELVKELAGPIYHHAGKEQDWVSTVCGVQKRDLARSVLSTLANTTALGGFAGEWQRILRAAAAEEAAL